MGKSQLIMANVTVHISYLDTTVSSFILLSISSALNMSGSSKVLLDSSTTALGFLPDTVGSVASPYIPFQGFATQILDVSGGSTIEVSGLVVQSTDPGNVTTKITSQLFNVVTKYASLNESSCLRITDNYIAAADTWILESVILNMVDGICSCTLHPELIPARRQRSHMCDRQQPVRRHHLVGYQHSGIPAGQLSCIPPTSWHSNVPRHPLLQQHHSQHHPGQHWKCNLIVE